MNERSFRSLHHTTNGMLPICNIQLIASKPCYLDLPNEDDISLGAELKRKRLELEWTQEQTAKHLGVRKDSYQNWEWNQITPHIRNRKKVVEFLGYNYWDDSTNSLSNKSLLYRIEYGLTMSELADLLNVSTYTIERIEGVKDNVSDSIKEKIKLLIV